MKTKTFVAEIYIPFGTKGIFWYVDIYYRGKLLASYKSDSHLSVFDGALQYGIANGFTHGRFFDQKVNKSFRIKL